MKDVIAKYLIPAGTVLFFILVGDWLGTQYYKGLSDPHLPQAFTRALGALSGLAAGASWLRDKRSARAN